MTQKGMIMSADVFRKSIALLASAGLLLSLGACSTSVPSASDASSSASSSETKRNQSVADDGSSDEKPSPSASADADLQVPEGSALDVLEQLPVKGRAPKTGYSRDQFGPAWSDVDHNGCDTRNDILNRDMSDKTYKANTHDCVVATGVLNDPYNLLAVDGPANQQKSDGDAATWLPANKSFRCEYVARQIGVKKKYELWVTQGEHDAMKNVLSSCPTQQVPTDGDGITPIEAQSPEPTATPEPAQTATPAPAPAQTQEQTYEPATESDANVYYKNCAAVRAAGKAPLHRGDPGYAPKLDRDGDGIACE